MRKIQIIFSSILILFTVSCSQPDATKSSSTAVNTDTSTIEATTNSTINEPSQSTSDDSIFLTMESYIDSLIINTPSYIPSWNKESFKGKWNYIDGVFLNSIVNLYKTTKNEKYKTFVLNYIDYYINSDGEFINPETKELAFSAEELDAICESRILFDAYEWTNDTRYLNAIEFTYNDLMSQTIAEGTPCYSHKLIYKNQIWLDGFYMYVPFLCRYALLKNDMSIFDDIIAQYEFIYANLRDKTTGLYYHGYDATKTIFWADSETGLSQSYWSRALGWYSASMADALEYFPEGANKAKLLGMLNELFTAVSNYQDSTTKMYYQLTDKDSSFSTNVAASYFKGLKNNDYQINGQYVDTVVSNYLETSGSCLIAYAMLKSGIAKFKEPAKETFMGTYNYSLEVSTTEIKLNNICITAGLGPENKPYRDGTPAYYLAEKVGSDDAKGVGPFIMAYIECMKNA